MRFATRVFLLAGVSGVILVAPGFFLERWAAEIDPPAVSHPQYFYGFVGIVLVYQFLYLLIATDPVRFRPVMLFGALGKASFVAAVVILYVAGRTAPLWLGLASFDVFWVVLFLIAYGRSSGHPGQAKQPVAPSAAEKINLREKLTRFSDHWNPRVVADLNGQQAKLVKFQGEFVWHHHDNEDELFLVVEGRFRMDFRDRQVWLEEGEFLVVPRGVEHRPVAEQEVAVLLFEPAATLNTGNVRNERTVADLQRV
jgi:mannose-6-phosphate isomerase-like protein (cupin superfamily)